MEEKVYSICYCGAHGFNVIDGLCPICKDALNEAELKKIKLLEQFSKGDITLCQVYNALFWSE